MLESPSLFSLTPVSEVQAVIGGQRTTVEIPYDSDSVYMYLLRP